MTPALRKIRFIVAAFAATALLMALQKPLFLAWYAREAAGASAAELFGVLWHGLKLDLTVAGYVTVPLILITLLSLWIRIPDRVARRRLGCWFGLVTLLTAVVVAVDAGLYAHWGFRLDATIFIYLADPKEALGALDLPLILRQTLLAVAVSAVMWGVYRPVIRLFDGERLAPPCRALGWSIVMLLVAGLDFLAIRGGVGTSVANVSKVYFSPKMFLNHAATNPLFSLLATLGDNTDYEAEYPFFDEETRARKFDALRGNAPVPQDAVHEQAVTARRPNVVLVILESFARTIMDTEVDGQAVMPNMRRLAGEGIWFENFFANSFRTDRGEVAIMSGFPAQTRISIMKLPGKSRSLPSVARSLGREGYRTRFVYGGDLNFTNQSSYMYATGWQELVWQKDLHFDAPTSKWGYADDVVCDWFADEVIAMDAADDGPFLAGLLTLSSHHPFDVPFERFDDKELNAFAFTDDCVGRMIDRLKASPAWENLLVVLVADHGFPYPATLPYNVPLRHRIPMIWTGGAVPGPRTVDRYGSQIDLAATLLGQLGIAHDDFDYSKDLFLSSSPAFAYYAFNDGFGVVTADGEAIWDATGDRMLSETAPGLADIGRTMLQTTYTDIGRR